MSYTFEDEGFAGSGPVPIFSSEMLQKTELIATTKVRGGKDDGATLCVVRGYYLQLWKDGKLVWSDKKSETTNGEKF